MENILRSRSCRSLVIGLALMIGGTASRSSAQSTTAALTGDVVDEQGAVVPGARVSAIHADSGFKRAVNTNDRGSFAFPPLPPGHYRVETQRKDFATAVIPNLELNVNDRKNIRIPLTIGTIEQSIEVTGTVGTNNRSGAVSTVIDRQFASELPLNGRSFDALISLTPGSAVTTAQSWEPGQFSINGQRPNANYFTVDGVGANTAISHTDHLEQTGAGTSPPRSALGGTNNFVPVDAVQEFRLETSSYAPEFGRMPGVQVSIITRSGSNSFHGTVFDYFRNDALDANDWFANSQHLEKAALRQNDFGGVLSGPIVQSRTFFFASYEGLRLRLPQVATLTLVPAISLRQAAPPSVQPLLNAFPIPNGNDLGDGTAEYSASASNPSTVNAAGLRIDHRINARLSLFGRYHQADSNAVFRGGLSGGSFSNFGRSIDKNVTVTLGAVAAFGPRIHNDFRFNYSAVTAGGEFLIDDFGGAVAPPASALFLPSVDPTTAGYLFQFLHVAGWNYGPASRNRQRQINIVDTVTAAIENHTLRFGVDYRRLSPITEIQPYSLQVAMNSSSDVLSGVASLIQVNASKGSLNPIFQNFSAYAQDAWRLGRRLTLTYGLRWELNPPPSEANGELPYTVPSLDNPANLTLAPKGTAMYQTTYGNFAPRAAAAYTLFEMPGRETVLRGGFGVFYDLGSGTASSAFYAGGFSNGSSQQLVNVQFPLNPEVVAPPPFSTSPPYPLLVVTDPDLTLPRTYEWNVAVEQSVGRNQSVTVSYVGAAGRRLLRREFIARPNSNFNPGVEVTRNGAVSNYAALQIQFQRRLARGVQAIASYTWSHSLDNDSFESEAFHPTSETVPTQDYGSSSFDLRHSFSAGVTWNIPGPAENVGIARLFHSWAVDTILRMYSAPPVDVISSLGLNGTTRPDSVPGIPLYIYDRELPGGRRINPAAFVFPPQNQQGTLSRNALRGFPVSQTEMAVVREFALSEQVKLQFRMEAFNVFNHPNFASPVRRIRNTSQFGRSTSMLNNSLGFDAGLNPLYQIGGPRSLQLSLKLTF